MASKYSDFVNQFVQDFERCHEAVSDRDFTLEDVEEILTQNGGESDAQFAGRCIGIFHAYAFAAANYEKFKELGFITPASSITPNLMMTLYIFFGGSETPPKPEKVQMELFINAVRQRQKRA